MSRPIIHCRLNAHLIMKWTTKCPKQRRALNDPPITSGNYYYAVQLSALMNPDLPNGREIMKQTIRRMFFHLTFYVI